MPVCKLLKQSLYEFVCEGERAYTFVNSTHEIKIKNSKCDLPHEILKKLCTFS